MDYILETLQSAINLMITLRTLAEEEMLSEKLENEICDKIERYLDLVSKNNDKLTEEQKRNWINAEELYQTTLKYLDGLDEVFEAVDNKMKQGISLEEAKEIKDILGNVFEKMGVDTEIVIRNKKNNDLES